MPDSVSVPVKGQKGTVTVTGAVVAGLEPGRDGAMVCCFDIGTTGDELVLDMLSGHAVFEPDPPEPPEHFPPALPGEIWSARDRCGALQWFVTVFYDRELTFTPLHHHGPWDNPAPHYTAGYMREKMVNIRREREGVGQQ